MTNLSIKAGVVERKARGLRYNAINNTGRQKMRNTIIFSCLLFFISFSYGQSKSVASKNISTLIKIKWVSNLKGNFSFKTKWIYPEGIYKNEYGQLSCDGFCPPGAETMKDITGKIFKDSISAFYKIVDTTHHTYSINCKAWCYEWAGTDFIDVIRKSADSVFCYTLNNAATHCSLELDIVGNNCFATINLNSVVKGGSAKFYCTNGYITIDKPLWSKGIMKAIFSFNFSHKDNPKKPIYWNGKIYSRFKQI